MNYKQAMYAVLLAAAAILVAWGISFVGGKAPDPVSPGTQSPAGDYVYTEGDQYYSIEAHYPATTTLSGGADVAARSAVAQGVESEVANFKQILAQSLSDEEKARIAQAGRPYTFEGEYEEFPSAHYESFLYLFYEDTGGAHPNGYFKTFVFDNTGSPVALGDLFGPGADYLGRISQAASAQVDEQVTNRLGADAAGSVFAEGLAPTPDNYQNFVLEGDTLHIFFPPYQVAAYAAGTFDIAIPLSSLADILKLGVR